jgi:hypothetical protein
MFRRFTTVKKERVNKTAYFFGKAYPCKHFWLVLRKPAGRRG